ncbi:DUF190 domain-containing protein [Nitrosomonas sp. HPC101]|uniref:DUF190 domain-containing protein n=1 Tax=Nitrosomonas sp. HPC101 TaxID=1658667 RepID=UPI00136C0C34|nr:DUF190 domain-containing protein [Nitrosomonas sp. HPC101]MXS85347.1 DUF190 domain-containing protein [Nitrosomonas sp. HPC101]
MQGYQLTFFTQQNRTHKRQFLSNWLIEEAHKLGIGGATLIAATEGFGRDRKLHAARFFELADQPIEITMALSEAESKRLFQRLHDEKINMFYIKIPIEFGMTDDLPGDQE